MKSLNISYNGTVQIMNCMNTQEARSPGRSYILLIFRLLDTVGRVFRNTVKIMKSAF